LDRSHPGCNGRAAFNPYEFYFFKICVCALAYARATDTAAQPKELRQVGRKTRGFPHIERQGREAFYPI
jgi:hypothetical protein